jgi:hypothetical protein
VGSKEERMKSVDRVFEPEGYGNFYVYLAYVFMIIGSLLVFGRLRDEFHLHGLSFHTVMQILALPCGYLLPFLFSFRFSKYIKKALEENIVSERVAKNCEFWIGFQLFVVYFVISILIEPH